jgi:cytochrome c551/c552
MMRFFYSIAISVVMISCNNSSGKQAEPRINPNIDAAGLYTMHCGACHKCDVDFTGPSLKGAASRWKDRELMYEFIRNPMAVIQKDSYAAALHKKYKTVMIPSMLSREEIDAVLDYCNNQ